MYMSSLQNSRYRYLTKERGGYSCIASHCSQWSDRGNEDNCLCSQMLVFAWLPMSILHTVDVYERDGPRVGERDKRENREGLQRVCWCVCAKAVSLIGQMSCVHYKRGTLLRWGAVSPGIRSVEQQSTRPQGGLSGWLTELMERMCHVEHVCVLMSHSCH